MLKSCEVLSEAILFMGTIECDLIKPYFLVYLLHLAFLFSDHLQLRLHLFQLLLIVYLGFKTVLIQLCALQLFHFIDLLGVVLVVLHSVAQDEVANLVLVLG